MTLLKCGNSTCGHVFDEGDAGSYEERTRSEFWGTVAWTTESFLTCPLCGESEDLDEVEEDDDLNDELDDEPFDFEKIKKEAKEAVRNEFTNFLLETAREPWKKLA